MSESSRRTFLKSGAASAALASTSLGALPAVHAAGSDEIRVGVIGCGGRGTGAAGDALRSSSGVRLVAMGDAFPDRLDASRKRLTDRYGDVARVPDDRCFTGLDAFEKVLASDANYIVLATPPGFRPQHLKAAVAAGKQIFTEKPVAVDGPGIRSVLETYEEARQKNLGIGAGTQRRHQTGYLEAMKRVHEGAIGEIVAARCYWNQGGLWHKAREAGWSDLEWQVRNWLYFTWLSGDHIVEQHVHNLDVVNWAMKTHPVKAMGMGGRQSRTGPEFGHIFDHFAVDYEYPGEVHVMSMCRQIDNCAKSVSEALVGTRGQCKLSANAYYQIAAGKTAWSLDPKKDDNQPYVQEHTDLIASIRAGKPINELKNVAESTLTAIMGRMSCYSGKAVTWEEALNAQEALVPAQLSWGPMPTPAVAIPGLASLE
jgi:predicted dehydrogenase